MFNRIASLLSGKTHNRPVARTTRLGLESLEGRDCASVSVTNPTGIYGRGAATENRIAIVGDDLANRVDVVHYSDYIHNIESIRVFVEGQQVKNINLNLALPTIVNVDLKGGADSFSYRVDAPFLVEAPVKSQVQLNVELGDGRDVAILEFAATTSRGQVSLRNNLDVSVNGGTGADNVVTTFGLIRETGHVNYRLDLGDGSEDSLTQLGTTNLVGDLCTGGSLAIEMYGGDIGSDTLQLRMFADGLTDNGGYVQLMGDGQVMTALLDGRGGNDKILVEGDVMFTAGLGLQLDGGAGIDTVTAKFRKLDYSEDATLEIAIHGGIGNDTLGLSVTNTGPIYAKAEKDQYLIDGGLGTDNVTSWSTAAVKFSCEGVV